MLSLRNFACLSLLMSVLMLDGISPAQSVGNSGSVSGTVLDSSGAVVANATVEIHNPVSGFSRSASTDSAGKFGLNNVPFNPYHLSVTAQGFATYAQDLDLRSSVPLTLKISLQVAGSSTTVTVEGWRRPPGN